MENISTIYYNDFGVAFQWQKHAAFDSKKIQLVFRNTGFYLTLKELIQFSTCVEMAIESPLLCLDCNDVHSCKSLLLKTPFEQVNFVMSFAELNSVNDLIKGTFFQLKLDKFLENQFINKS